MHLHGPSGADSLDPCACGETLAIFFLNMRESMKNTNFFCLTLLAMLLAMPAIAQDIPDAKTVIEKNIKAIGGRAKLESIKSAHYQGGMVMPGGPAGDMEGEVEIFQLKNKFLMATNISTPQGKMEIKQGTDGETLWSIQPPTGTPQIVEGDQAAAAKEMYGQVFPSLSWLKYDGEVKNEGIAKAAGKECYKLMFTPKKGTKITRYFDKETGHLLKVSTKQKSPMMGEIEISHIHEDYKEVDGIMVSHKQVTDMGVAQIEIEMEKIEFNKDIDAKKFELPESVKAMVDEKKEAEMEKEKAGGV